MAQIAVTAGANSDTVADTGDVSNTAVLRTPTSGTEIKIRNDGVVSIEFDPPSEDRAYKIIIRAAEMGVSVYASPEHGRHLRPSQPWSERYERIALADRALREARREARVANDLVVSAEEALHRAKVSAPAQEEIGLPPVEYAAPK